MLRECLWFLVSDTGKMYSVLTLICCCSLAIMEFMLLFLILSEMIQRFTRPEASQRQRMPRCKKEEPKILADPGLREEELEETCACLEMCCRLVLEKHSLAHILRIVERRLQYLDEHLDEFLIPLSVQNQLGASNLDMASLAHMIPSIPALCSPDRKPMAQSTMRYVPFQEPCACSSGSPSQKASWSLASHEAIHAGLEPKVVAKMQRQGAEQSTEIRIKAFSKMAMESHRNVLLLPETPISLPFPPRSEQGKPRSASFPLMGQESPQPVEHHERHKHLVMQWGQPILDPEPVKKLSATAPATGARVEFYEMEIDFVLDEVTEKLGWHMQRKKLQQEWGLPQILEKSQRAFLPSAPKVSVLKEKPSLVVVPILTELLFLERDIKKQLESHILKMQVQQKWGLPRRIQGSLQKFMSPAPGDRGQLSCPMGRGIVTPYRSPFPPGSKKAQSIQLPRRTPPQRCMEGVHGPPMDIRQEVARSYPGKHPGAVTSKGKETPEHNTRLQMGLPSTSPTQSSCPPTPVQDAILEMGRSGGTAGNQTNLYHDTLLAGADLASPLQGTKRTEKMVAATLHLVRSKLEKPLPCESGTKGTKVAPELHTERRVMFEESSCLQTEEGRADLPKTQYQQDDSKAGSSGQFTRSILESLIAGQAAHRLQLQCLMEKVNGFQPSAGHVSVEFSVCQLCHEKMKEKKTQKETQVSPEPQGLHNITAPQGFHKTLKSKFSGDQQPMRVCKKCSKLWEKTPAGSAAPDLPRRSHGRPQSFTLGESSAQSSHNKVPVVWLAEAERSKTHGGMRKREPTNQPKMVSIATSTTGLCQAGDKTTESPGGSPPNLPNIPRARTSSAGGNKFTFLKQICMCLKQTFLKLQKKVKTRMSHDARSRIPDVKFTKPPFWRLRANKGVRFPYY